MGLEKTDSVIEDGCSEANKKYIYSIGNQILIKLAEPKK